MDKRAWIKPLACMVAAFALAMIFFYFLYHHDNKYTWDGPQPIAGLLVLNKADLEAHPLQFLCHQWQFYPDVLLSPEDMTYGGTSPYSRYVFIGQYSGFNAGNHHLPRQGQGSYRLDISVPDEEREYALELPEVFSACRLYINGRLALTLGVPEKERYSPEIHSRVVTFLARDRIEILLAVSNYAHYTGGLTYPPAFGHPLAVQSARDARLIIRAAACLLALFAALFALWAGLRLRRLRSLMFSLLCLCFIGAVGYPLLHAFVTTGVQPWYTLELICYYALLSLTVALHNTLCSIHKRARRAVLLAIAAFCLLAMGYGLGASWADNTLALAFSALSALFKLLTAFWLLFSSAWAVYKQTPRATPILAASVAFAASLLADRLWPLYEPVYGGWFAEIGGAALVVALAAMLWSHFMEAYRLRVVFLEERRHLIRQIDLQRSHYQRLAGQIEEARFLRHDLRHHMRTLQGFARDRALSDIQSYLEQLEPGISDGEPLSYTSHPAANAIVQHFAALAKGLGARMEIEMDIPAEIPFPSDELCIILSNIMENAVEALLQQQKGEKHLYIKCRFADGRLALVAENSFDGQVRQRGERFYSGKRDGFGIGIESVRAITQRRGGMCGFEARGNVFHASVLIYAGAGMADAAPSKDLFADPYF